MEQDLTLAEAVLPYEVRHSIWDPDEIEQQLVEKGLCDPDAVYLFSVPDSEEERHAEQIEELMQDIEAPEKVYFSENDEDAFSSVLNSVDAVQVPITYPETSSRQADFEALNEYFDPEDTFLGVAVDYAVPRNHCEAFEAVDGWQGPENGFAASVDGEMEKGGSVLNYLSDRFNTREWMRETPEFTGELEIKDGDHYIVGTTYGDEFSDYRSKFGFSTESELIRSVTPQRLKDWAKGSRLTGSEF